MCDSERAEFAAPPVAKSTPQSVRRRGLLRGSGRARSAIGRGRRRRGGRLLGRRGAGGTDRPALHEEEAERDDHHQAADDEIEEIVAAAAAVAAGAVVRGFCHFILLKSWPGAFAERTESGRNRPLARNPT